MYTVAETEVETAVETARNGDFDVIAFGKAFDVFAQKCI
jgi:hypothetical protein